MPRSIQAVQSNTVSIVKPYHPLALSIIGVLLVSVVNGMRLPVEFYFVALAFLAAVLLVGLWQLIKGRISFWWLLYGLVVTGSLGMYESTQIRLIYDAHERQQLQVIAIGGPAGRQFPDYVPVAYPEEKLSDHLIVGKQLLINSNLKGSWGQTVQSGTTCLIIKVSNWGSFTRTLKCEPMQGPVFEVDVPILSLYEHSSVLFQENLLVGTPEALTFAMVTEEADWNFAGVSNFPVNMERFSVQRGTMVQVVAGIIKIDGNECFYVGVSGSLVCIPRDKLDVYHGTLPRVYQWDQAPWSGR